MLADRRPRLVQPRKAAKWTNDATPASASRQDLNVNRWRRANPQNSETDSGERFEKYNVKLEVPEYDDETYEKALQDADADWTREETDYLIDVYRECNAKWPIIADHYDFEGGKERSMEELKKRFYHLSAQLLQLRTPIASMGTSDYQLYETLTNFNPDQEKSRKKLAELHLYRKANEVDEEMVLLSELQRIMLNQATLDSQREELRRRLDYPNPATNGYQYTTSQALTQLWQQLLAQDRMKKNPRLRPTGNPAYDGPGAGGIVPPLQTSSSHGPRASTAGLSDAGGALPSRRQTRDSLPSATPQSALPDNFSKADKLRYGIVEASTDNTKPSSGISFASDRVIKPRTAKSTIMTEKIGAVLTHIGVPELIVLPTPRVVEQFDEIMSKVHALLEMRKIADKEEQELRVRQAELGQ
ncbi:SWR1-complex protein 4 [Pseudocercospora fuligena]|uniref:SWR1-complex protein 4 n=1 Tax=Pseudocercospora fuligena TaxID=685502 RepID=A0A8H6R6R5_9PEZI|nr:SWR1-complex protein 4 [Pseudocercospora fuligena]